MRHDPVSATGAANHTVQFYENDAFLTGAVADFLAGGLTAGQSLIVIATEPRRTAFRAALAAKGFDVESACRAAQLTFLDARETLSSFMAEAVLDDRRFKATVGSLIDGSRRASNHSTVRVYGEMVDLLWKDGNPEGAIRLEELWNELTSTHDFSLFCAYAMSNFYAEAHAPQFQEVCRQHRHVLPTERYTRLDDETRLLEVSMLQQRARALETEIEHRKKLERALREALAERCRAEDALRRADAERERLLEQEQAARAEAEAASRLKDEFLAVLSHELRTPLNAVLGWTEIVNGPRADEATTRRALQVIHRNARLQLHLIDDLLDVSRIVTGKMQLSTNPVDLTVIVTTALDSVRPAAAAKEIGLGLEVDESVRWVTGDVDRLQQVVWNLVSNAVKFTPKHGRVELRLERAGSEAQIVVRDTGQGIVPEFLPHVFDRFRQGDTSSTRKHGGLGLGLAVVRYLVEAHGGTVSASSPGEGLGATFSVRLPLRAALPEVVVGRLLNQQPVVLKEARVLVVDDDRDARELLQYVLEQSGAVVETAASAGEAVGLVSTKPFDVLLADIGMPAGDGYGLIATIRSLSQPRVRAIRAVAVTAYAGDHHRARAIAAGYDAYLTKPVQPGRLAQLVSELLPRGFPVRTS